MLPPRLLCSLSPLLFLFNYTILGIDIYSNRPKNSMGKKSYMATISIKISFKQLVENASIKYH